MRLWHISASLAPPGGRLDPGLTGFLAKHQGDTVSLSFSSGPRWQRPRFECINDKTRHWHIHDSPRTWNSRAGVETTPTPCPQITPAASEGEWALYLKVAPVGAVFSWGSAAFQQLQTQHTKPPWVTKCNLRLHNVSFMKLWGAAWITGRSTAHLTPALPGDKATKCASHSQGTPDGGLTGSRFHLKQTSPPQEALEARFPKGVPSQVLRLESELV